MLKKKINPIDLHFLFKKMAVPFLLGSPEVESHKEEGR